MVAYARNSNGSVTCPSLKAGQLSELLASQWNGPEDTGIALQMAPRQQPGAQSFAEVASFGPPVEVAALTHAWLDAQLACDCTPTGELLGARVLIAPTNRHWRVYVLVPLLGAVFPSGKLNECPAMALQSATRRWVRRHSASALTQPLAAVDES